MKNRLKDRTRDYTLNILDILQDELKVEFSDSGKPIFIPGRVTDTVMHRLRASLHDLDNSSEQKAAISDLALIKEECPACIQTTAVGYSSDFNLQIKLGLLLGDRLVLWDTVIRSILSSDETQLNTEYLGIVVNQLIGARPIVEHGAIILLPQPRTWLPRVEDYYNLMPDSISSNNTLKGYVNASALLAEGFSLHPYISVQQEVHDVLIHYGTAEMEPYYSEEKSEYHSSLCRLLTDQRLAFLSSIGAVEFYEALNSLGGDALRRLQRELSQRLAYPLVGLSPEEKNRLLDETVEELAKLAPSANRMVMDNRWEMGLAGVSAVKASLGVAADVASAGMFSTILSGVSAARNLGSFLRQVFDPEEVPVLYQVFSELSRAEMDQVTLELQDEWSTPGASGNSHFPEQT